MKTPHRLSTWIRRARRDPFQAVLALACTGVVVGSLVIFGVSAAGSLTEVLLFLAAMLLRAAGTPPTAAGNTDLVESVRSEIEVLRRQEAAKGGLLVRDFVPLSFRTHPDDRPWFAAGRNAFWTTAQFQNVTLKVFNGAPCGRLIVYGGRGSGKTVLAAMLSLALLRLSASTSGTKLIPLPVSLASWRPAEEEFGRWLDRVLVRLYPSLRAAPDTLRLGPVRAVIMGGRFVPVLDGLDEVPRQQRELAIVQLCEYFQPGIPVVLLTREKRSFRHRLSGAAEVWIEPVPASQVADYLVHLERKDRNGVHSGTLPEILRSEGGGGGLRRLMTRPLYIDLVESALVARQVTPEELVITASQQGEGSLREALVRWRLRRALTGLRWRRAATYLVYLAQQMSAHGSNVLPWWRLVDVVPARVLICVVVDVVAVPAYLLALRMPLGLTRGLAIGVIAGFAFGMLRGRQNTWSDLSWTLITLPLVLTGEGCLLAGPRQGVADAVEITTATLLALGYRQVLAGPGSCAAPKAETSWGRGIARKIAQAGWRELITGGPARRWWLCLPVLAVIGLVTSGMTAGVSRAMHFHDQNRNPETIFVAAVFGLGIAAVAARLLIVSRERLAPSTVSLTLSPRTIGLFQASRAGLTSAMTIGVGGGVGGGMRLGLMYGLMLTVVFGIVVGVPVGVAGGAIRWLSAPVRPQEPAVTLAEPVDTAPSTLTTDRAVALASMIGIGLAAAAGIGLLIGPLRGVAERIDQSSSFVIAPSDGILFGLTAGLIVASFNTAWLDYLVAHVWLVLLGCAPIRLAQFLDELHRLEILRREGSYFMFRHQEYQHYLADHGAAFVSDLASGR